MSNSVLREQLSRLLDWSDAHVNFDGAIAGVPIESRGTRVEGFPHSLWELVEHIRVAQADILEFCRNPAYVEPRWPEEYWPATSEPPTAESWDESLASLERDRVGLQTLASNPDLDLFSAIPHGSGQTYLRELILAADHTSYHVGQIVCPRRMLGIWGPD